MGGDGVGVPRDRRAARRRRMRPTVGARARARIQLGHRRWWRDGDDGGHARGARSLDLDRADGARAEPARCTTAPDAAAARAVVLNPGGRTRSRSGSTAPHEVEIDGHVGYYCAGMNKLADVRDRGNCGVGVAENMMSGVGGRRGQRDPVGRRDAPAAGCSSSTATRPRAAGSRSRAPTSSCAARSGT